MTLKTYLKNPEKRSIISRKPSPIIPFIIALAFIVLYSINPINYKPIEIALKILFIFSLIFAIIHLIMHKILTSK